MIEREKQKVKNLLKELQVYTKRSLGQNFLINSQAQNRFLHWVEELKPQWIVEVGPGLGALTLGLEKRVPLENLLLIEKDKSLAQYWIKKNYTVLEEDAFKGKLV